MPNINAVLREEIARVARKELRSETETVKKASAQYRREIAALKRRAGDLERQVALLERKVLKDTPVAPSGDGDAKTRVRFTAKGLRTQRRRLGLTAADYAKLVGVSTQSVYNWEREIARPRSEQLAILAALRGISKAEARARLRQLGRD